MTKDTPYSLSWWLTTTPVLLRWIDSYSPFSDTIGDHNLLNNKLPSRPGVVVLEVAGLCYAISPRSVEFSYSHLFIMLTILFPKD